MITNEHFIALKKYLCHNPYVCLSAKREEIKVYEYYPRVDNVKGRKYFVNHFRSRRTEYSPIKRLDYTQYLQFLATFMILHDIQEF
jgi:hypothetical protein